MNKVHPMSEPIEMPVVLEPEATYAPPKIVELGVARILTGGTGDRASDSGPGMFSA